MPEAAKYLSQSFDLLMEEAKAFWNDKVQIGAGQYAKLSAEAKSRAFAISGIAKGDELNTVFTALQKGIERGDSFGKFKKECGDIFERRGWTGKRSWRVDNIYRTNIQTAYNVGRYKQLKEEASVFPYWQYDAVNDKRTRPTHLAMDGRVWPQDHAVWNTWYPPNGYRCRCSVIGITRGQMERRKIQVEEEDITERLIEPISPVSGEKMPGRQMLPDIGFEHNPGEVYWEQFARVVIDRLKTYPDGLALMVEKDLSDVGALEELLNAPESPESDFEKETASSAKK